MWGVLNSRTEVLAETTPECMLFSECRVGAEVTLFLRNDFSETSVIKIVSVPIAEVCVIYRIMLSLLGRGYT